MNVVWRPQARDELAVILAKISQEAQRACEREFCTPSAFFAIGRI
jgi:hypothetical protein